MARNRDKIVVFYRAKQKYIAQIYGKEHRYDAVYTSNGIVVEPGVANNYIEANLYEKITYYRALKDYLSKAHALLTDKFIESNNDWTNKVESLSNTIDINRQNLQETREELVSAVALNNKLKDELNTLERACNEVTIQLDSVLDYYKDFKEFSIFGLRIMIKL